MMATYAKRTFTTHLRGKGIFITHQLKHELS